MVTPEHLMNCRDLLPYVNHTLTEHLMNCRGLLPYVNQPRLSQEGNRNSLHTPPRSRGPFRKNDIFKCPVNMTTPLQTADHHCSFAVDMWTKQIKCSMLPMSPQKAHSGEGTHRPFLNDQSWVYAESALMRYNSVARSRASSCITHA